MDTGRPSQKNQRSRKGKKSWRKNIDLDDVEEGLEHQQEAAIVLGPDAAAQPLFSIDTAGDENALTRDMKSEKKLKTYEILHRRSAFPALNAVPKKQVKTTKRSSKPINELLRVGGRTNESALKAAIDRDGLLKSSGNVDLWGGDITSTTAPPSVTTSNSYRAVPPNPRQNRLPEPSLPGTEAVMIPDGGRSYNPALKEWTASIALENEKLEKVEQEREKMLEAKLRIEALLNAPEPASAEDSDSEPSSRDDNGRLSVNPPVKNKKKTQAKINKKRRHRERELLHTQLRDLKRQLRELEHLPQLLERLNAAKAAKSQQDKVPHKYRHGKHPVMDEPLAIKLSDELDDSLRRLRSEGNLARERFRSFQARGLVEPRKPLTKKDKKKPRRHVTEKWSYKDIRL